ncbi:hypothetical protein BDV12DRAFT_165600 [Aspergillus spectabilis]
MSFTRMPEESGTELKENKLLQINLSTQIICFTFVTPFVFLRLIIRRRLRHPISIEDVTCFLAWLLFMGYCTCALIYGFSGGAQKMAKLSLNQIETSSKISYASTIIYAPLTLLVKVTLLLVLAKIYRPLRGAIAVYAILSLNVSYYITILFVKAFICSPVSTYWTMMSKLGGKCLDRPAVIIADSLISVISDIAILVLPVIFTWPLQMPVKVKLKVIALLGLGGIAVAFSLYRLVLLILDGNTPDQTILFMRVLLSGNAEGGIGLICACLPALSKYITRCREKNNSSQQKQKHTCWSSNTIFDGSQNCNEAVLPLQSHVETHIWRSSTALAETSMPHESQIPACNSPMAIQKKVTVHQQCDINSNYSRPT